MWRRLLVFGCAGSASLALASGVPAKTPQLVVSGATEIGASAATVIRVKEEKTDAAPFRTSIYLPSGYVANLGQSAGTQVGTVTMSVQQLALSPDAIDVAGTMLTDTPSKYAGNLCAPGKHAAVWLLHVVVQGATFDVPAYVDPTTGQILVRFINESARRPATKRRSAPPKSFSAFRIPTSRPRRVRGRPSA